MLDTDPARERARKIRWFDATMNAAMWLKCASVAPDEAAMLLCGIDPVNETDPERIYVDDDRASPDRYRLLWRVFLDAETDPKPRTLLDWREVAKREGLRYHEWIDDYVQAQIEELPADAGSAAKVGGGATATIEKPETKNWILLIQAEAARRWKLLRDAGANPTKNNLKDDLAKWCRESSVATDGGINPTAEYITGMSCKNGPRQRGRQVRQIRQVHFGNNPTERRYSRKPLLRLGISGGLL